MPLSLVVEVVVVPQKQKERQDGMVNGVAGHHQGDHRRSMVEEQPPEE